MQKEKLSFLYRRIVPAFAFFVAFGFLPLSWWAQEVYLRHRLASGEYSENQGWGVIPIILCGAIWAGSLPGYRIAQRVADDWMRLAYTYALLVSSGMFLFDVALHLVFRDVDFSIH